MVVVDEIMNYRLIVCARRGAKKRGVSEGGEGEGALNNSSARREGHYSSVTQNCHYRLSLTGRGPCE